MNPTRRDLSFVFPAMLMRAPAAARQVLPSATYEFASLAVQRNAKTHNESRQVFDGLTHEGCPVNLHITTLASGEMPHASHHHEWEEMIFIQNGTLEVNINGKVTRGGSGSVVYVASNEEHGWKNVGDIPSQYFVVALGERG